MYTVTVEEIQEKLPQILEDVKHGIEVIIEQNNIAIARIQSTPAEQPPKRSPILGTSEGQVWMAPDFDETPEDFADYL